MGSGFSHHEPHEACGSSDGLARYLDGSGHCFVCKGYEKGEGETMQASENAGATNTPRKAKLLEGAMAQPLPARCIDLSTAQKFSYFVGTDEAGRPCQIATYFDASGQPCAQKVRYQDKSFRWVGDSKRALLFGAQLWRGDARRVVITEGEIDALSVAQVQGCRWPVVSVPNGAQAAKKDLAKHVEWLETFEEIVFMFDEDEPGRAAVAECVELFTPGKARIASIPLKDANEMLKAGRVKELVTAQWEAKPYRPDGIVSGADLWDLINEKLERGLPYPWAELDTMLLGQRRRELVCWTGGTGTGKSQVLKELAQALVDGGETVGIISLEESVKHAALCQVSLAANARLHLPGERERVSDHTFRDAYEATLGTGRLFFYDHFGSLADTTLLPKIRYMAKALGVGWIVLDHISIMVSGMATEGDERKRIDELMTKLRSLAEELNIGIHFVSHLRKASGTPFEEGGMISLQDLRGSGAIAQVSNLVVGLERNQQAEDPSMRNRLSLRVLKNRYSGTTGVAGALSFDNATGRIRDAVLTAPDATAGFTAQTTPDGEAMNQERGDF